MRSSAPAAAGSLTAVGAISSRTASSLVVLGPFSNTKDVTMPRLTGTHGCPATSGNSSPP